MTNCLTWLGLGLGLGLGLELGLGLGLGLGLDRDELLDLHVGLQLPCAHGVDELRGTF